MAGSGCTRCPTRPRDLDGVLATVGVSETRAELDGSVIPEAAERAVILGPQEPVPDYR
jgi:hypothetical protein